MIHLPRKLVPLLLLAGLAASPRAAPNPQQQAVDPEVQKFLDVPVWYLSWRISLQGSWSDGGTATLRHVRNGSAELGIRSQGPVLTILKNPALAAGSNTAWLGKALYTEFLLPFEIAALILTVALIAAVALTLRKRSGVRTQKPGEQVLVQRNERLRVVKMASEGGKGESA